MAAVFATQLILGKPQCNGYDSRGAFSGAVAASLGGSTHAVARSSAAMAIAIALDNDDGGSDDMIYQYVY